ncbi:Probable serine/threonine-protein kinase nek2 (Never in mitosis protein A-related protein kinase 2) (NimA-related protein kinase 2) [Durusdinium trenchii]|uniref:non-specific serine/threonine protein kinase n=1 Tax=Durusdinium trenchii TaxID=1381693 RepID=A0ABP0LDW3_9DINO
MRRRRRSGKGAGEVVVSMRNAAEKNRRRRQGGEQEEDLEELVKEGARSPGRLRKAGRRAAGGEQPLLGLGEEEDGVEELDSIEMLVHGFDGVDGERGGEDALQGVQQLQPFKGTPVRNRHRGLEVSPESISSSSSSDSSGSGGYGDENDPGDILRGRHVHRQGLGDIAGDDESLLMASGQTDKENQPISRRTGGVAESMPFAFQDADTDDTRQNSSKEGVLRDLTPPPPPDSQHHLQHEQGAMLVEREIPVKGYETIEQIGSGTYGKVYKVREKGNTSGDVFVLKQVPLNGLSKSEQEETINEAQLMISIEDHENIVKHYVSFIESDCLNMVMEFCGGGDLSRMIKENRENGKRFGEDFIWQVLIQVSSALHHLHAHRILHRDIKPENIFLDEHCEVKVGDLGLGRLLSSQSKFAHSTVGTPLYFSPELCEEALYDERSDIWALGCLVYQMATLRPPFLASNQLALAKKIVSDQVRPISNKYSTDLHFLVHKMLEKDPQQRPDTNQILAYGPVRIHMMKAKLNSREREIAQQFRTREKQLEDQVELLKKKLGACEQEMHHMRESYESVIAQVKESEEHANQYASELESELFRARQEPTQHLAPTATPGNLHDPAPRDREPQQKSVVPKPKPTPKSARGALPVSFKTPSMTSRKSRMGQGDKSGSMTVDPGKKAAAHRARSAKANRNARKAQSAGGERIRTQARLKNTQNHNQLPSRNFSKTPVKLRYEDTSVDKENKSRSSAAKNKTLSPLRKNLGPARRVPSSFVTSDAEEEEEEE